MSACVTVSDRLLTSTRHPYYICELTISPVQTLCRLTVQIVDAIGCSIGCARGRTPVPFSVLPSSPPLGFYLFSSDTRLCGWPLQPAYALLAHSCSVNIESIGLLRCRFRCCLFRIGCRSVPTRTSYHFLDATWLYPPAPAGFIAFTRKRASSPGLTGTVAVKEEPLYTGSHSLSSL